MTETGISPSKLAWDRFKRNPVSVIGLTIIALAVLVSIFGYMISPDKVPHANTQILEISTERPGFKLQFLKVRKNELSSKERLINKLFSGKSSSYEYIPMQSFRIEEDKIIVLEYSRYKDDKFYSEYLLADVFFPIQRTGYEYQEGRYSVFRIDEAGMSDGEISSLKARLEAEQIKTKRFLLGTDRFGRDMLSRMILGTRISLSVGFIAVVISLVLGIFLGGIAGYFRGWIDKVIMWLVNVVWSIPTLLMVISITLVLGKGYWQVFVAVGLTMWVEVARVVRGQVLGIREKEFIEAARALGMKPGRIIFRHIIPNVLTPVIIISAANFATAILMEAGLSFLGIGVQPPIPTWGGMIKDHYGYIIVNQGYLAFIPGIAIMLMVLAFTLVGNGLRDAVDTRG